MLLVLAAGLHLATTTSVFLVGRFQLMPSQFEKHGLGQFASDSIFYQGDVVLLTGKLRNEGVIAWGNAVSPLHVKAYSLSHFIFSRWAEPNVLTIEPLNLFYYLAILALVFKLAETLFDRRAGTLAMTVMALWPSFLLHTTQFLRDPLLISAILAFVLVMVLWLIKNYSWRWTLLTMGAGVLALVIIWIVRSSMWDAIRMVALTGFVLLVIRHVRDRRFFVGGVIGVLVMSGVVLLLPRVSQLKPLQRRETDLERSKVAEYVAQLSLAERIGRRRQAFADVKKIESSSSTASNIDNEVRLRTMSEIVRFVPHAAAVGFLAPFPNMWFAKGSQVGHAGRLVSGVEILFTYLIELLALISLWRMRKNLAVWLLAATVTLGLTGLGLIVLNIGSLYRFRYPFLALMIVLAAGGIGEIATWRAKRQKTADA